MVSLLHAGSQLLDKRLVRLDFHLPDMNGLQVCRALRSGRPSLVDIIAVTADRDVETVRKAIAYGVVQYLIKCKGRP